MLSFTRQEVAMQHVKQLLSLEGKAALVTGGGGGLGGAMALALAQAGADIVLFDLHADPMKNNASLIEKEGRRCLMVTGDVRKLDDIERAVRTVETRFGRMHIAVNSAGVNIRKPALDYTEEEWSTIIDINLKGLYFCCLKEARIMKDHGGGRIINISSLTSENGLPHRSIYGASKGGVTATSRIMATEWAPFGITVNCIGPGHMLTPLTEKYFATSVGEKILSQIPLGRFGVSADLAGAVVFLASDAAGYITGQTIYIDGGYMINPC
jgi:NAD(P)-dependent dehydrogenase (short-subunit alcohol dehydrogenase family)